MSDLQAEHIRPLTEYVQRLRDESPETQVPWFSFKDGGVSARALFVFQDPGPGALDSDFISRDNNDPSARNFVRYSDEAGILREQTASWNIVPWAIPKGSVYEHLPEGKKALKGLLPLFPHLEVVVLSGNPAKTAEHVVAEHNAEYGRTIAVEKMGHPGNNWSTAERKEGIRRAMERVSALLR